MVWIPDLTDADTANIKGKTFDFGLSSPLQLQWVLYSEIAWENW